MTQLFSKSTFLTWKRSDGKIRSGFHICRKHLDQAGRVALAAFSHRISRMLPHISQLKNLYVVERLSLTDIAKRFDTSKQVVHYHLVRAGVELRPRGIKKIVDPAHLWSLLMDEGMTFSEAADRLGVSVVIVSRVANEIGLGRNKYRCRSIPSLNTIKISESQTFHRTKILWDDYLRFYEKAKKLGIKLSIESIDGSTIRVRRVA